MRAGKAGLSGSIKADRPRQRAKQGMGRDLYERAVHYLRSGEIKPSERSQGPHQPPLAAGIETKAGRSSGAHQALSSSLFLSLSLSAGGTMRWRTSITGCGAPKMSIDKR
jgi:hypothetical protein